MATLITDPNLEQSLIEQRQAWGADHHDEVWEGVYIMAPNPNNEHQKLVLRFAVILEDVVGMSSAGMVLPGTNVASVGGDWTKNYRCPDVAVFLRDTKAVNSDTHWQGPADFLVEIVSPWDRTRENPLLREDRRARVVDRRPRSVGPGTLPPRGPAPDPGWAIGRRRRAVGGGRRAFQPSGAAAVSTPAGPAAAADRRHSPGHRPAVVDVKRPRAKVSLSAGVAPRGQAADKRRSILPAPFSAARIRGMLFL